MSNVTKEGIEVRPGQVWRDLDKRMGGRTVVVMAVYSGKATVKGVRASVLSISRMHKHGAGWELISEPSA